MTDLLLPSRRSFLRAALAAPAIIKLAPLMAIRPQPRNLLIPGRITYVNKNIQDIIDLLTQTNAYLADIPYECITMHTPVWRKLNSPTP